MSLQYEVFPDFYKKYEWVAEQDDVYFTGRENYLRNFWLDLCNLVGVGKSFRRNKAFIGPRKLGKTSFLRRCYNVTFWEQNQVIPFYYCFPQQYDMNLRDTARKITLKFLQQAVSFMTKDRKILKIESEQIIFSKLKKSNFKDLDYLEIYWEKTKEKIKHSEPKLALEAVWNWAKMLSNVFDKKTLLIIDEYQKTYGDLQEEGITVPCHESIADTVNNDDIFTIISGSKISMLAYEVLTPELYNRIPDETFYPLKEKEAYQLILKHAEGKGYKNIEQHVYKMVGGNPYYIKMLFTPTNYYYEKYNESKKWSSEKELDRIYNFEILYRNGEIYKFWEKHLSETYGLLNGDPKKQKGVTLKILKCIAEKKQEIHLDELRKKFPLVKNMKQKMEQLRKADLVRDSIVSDDVFNFCDVVLPVVLTKMHQKLLLGSTSKIIFEKYKQQWFQRDENNERRIERIEDNLFTLQKQNTHAKNKQNKIELEITSTKENLSEVKSEVKNYFTKEKKIKAKKQGNLNIKKGAKAESKFQRNINKYINAGNGVFSNYQLVGRLGDANIKLISGKTAQVDLFGELKSLNKNKLKKCLIIGEIKNRKTKVGKLEAQIFIEKIAMLQYEHKIRNTICIYICSAGFWKSASTELKNNNIFYSTSDKFMQTL